MESDCSILTMQLETRPCGIDTGLHPTVGDHRLEGFQSGGEHSVSTCRIAPHYRLLDGLGDAVEGSFPLEDVYNQLKLSVDGQRLPFPHVALTFDDMPGSVLRARPISRSAQIEFEHVKLFEWRFGG